MVAPGGRGRFALKHEVVVGERKKGVNRLDWPVLKSQKNKREKC